MCRSVCDSKQRTFCFLCLNYFIDWRKWRCYHIPLNLTVGRFSHCSCAINVDKLPTLPLAFPFLLHFCFINLYFHFDMNLSLTSSHIAFNLSSIPLFFMRRWRPVGLSHLNNKQHRDEKVVKWQTNSWNLVVRALNLHNGAHPLLKCLFHHNFKLLSIERLSK